MKKKHAIIAVCTFIVLTCIYLSTVFFAGKRSKSSIPNEEVEQVNNDSIVTDSISLNL